MKTYSFEFSGKWMGGYGVVRAKTPAEAVELANESIRFRMQKLTPITEADLTEVKSNTAVILFDGDY